MGGDGPLAQRKHADGGPGDTPKAGQVNRCRAGGDQATEGFGLGTNHFMQGDKHGQTKWKQQQEERRSDRGHSQGRRRRNQMWVMDRVGWDMYLSEDPKAFEQEKEAQVESTRRTWPWGR